MATRLLRLIAFLIASLLLAVPHAAAQTEATSALVDALGQGGFPQREAAINALAATGDPRVVPVLEDLVDGQSLSAQVRREGFGRCQDQRRARAHRSARRHRSRDRRDQRCRQGQGQQLAARQDPHRHRPDDPAEPGSRHPPVGRAVDPQGRRSRQPRAAEIGPRRRNRPRDQARDGTGRGGDHPQDRRHPRGEARRPRSSSPRMAIATPSPS